MALPTERIHVAIDKATRLMYYEIHDNKRADATAKLLEKALDFFHILR